MLSLIVARAKNNVIGKNNALPWYLPADLKHFRQVTLGRSVIMGRKTYESIVARLGHALPERQNIVISRHTWPATSSVVFVTSFKEALKAAKSDEVVVIGGAGVYTEALPQVEKIYLTEVEAEIPGDVYFPELNMDDWKEVAREPHQKDEKHPYNYSFVELVRRQ
ncbi:MAG TPA: dihydrofolate reductase [Verrucomicrobiae bacterium]|nr:dihydrofolate reductase [Verrucomicrobiae bacterium]